MTELKTRKNTLGQA